MNGDWVKVDTFTMQDILSNEVSYVHDGSETKSDRCIIFVSNDQGEQRNAFYIHLYLFFTSNNLKFIIIGTSIALTFNFRGKTFHFVWPITALIVLMVLNNNQGCDGENPINIRNDNRGYSHCYISPTKRFWLFGREILK